MIVRRTINKEAWSQFVLKHPKGSFFHSPEVFKVYSDSSLFEPVFLSVVDARGEILGIILAVIKKEHQNFLGYFSRRAIVFGGALIKNDDVSVYDFLIKQYNKDMRKKAIYTQIRNFSEFNKDLKNMFCQNGYKYEDHLNILVDLKKNKEELWAEVHSKRRNEIRRAKKEGTKFEIKDQEKDLKKCYSIIKSVYDRAKLPIPEYSFFKNLLSISGKELGLKLFCAENDGKIIGCMIAVVYKKVIYDYYAGAYSEYYNKYPNDLIPWEVFLWGKENNYTLFDFGGAGKPNIKYGVRDYKKKFGGDIVNFGRFLKVHNKLLMMIGVFLLKLWKKIR
tara:strand:+ start:176 stop:1177 length:1002 start_codon:yes stop_codon:yes gene_type:complete